MVISSAALARGGAQAELSVLGGKGMGLARLVREGLVVPPFFVLPPGADPAVAVRAWQATGWEQVAVRSSAIGEDSALHSFAGMYETVLGVSDADGLRAGIERCRDSAKADRVTAYREQAGLEETPVAVVIQQMVEGEVSGVLFGRNPDNPDQALISAAFGLGEGVVQGSVPADTFSVRLTDGAVTAWVAEKDRRVSLVDGVPRELPVDLAEQLMPCLTDAQAKELARLGLRLERALGAPQDIEWTYQGGRLVVLQTRPITRPVPRGRRLLWDNSNIIESYHGPVSPLTFSFASRAYTIVYQLFSEVMGVDRETIQAHSGTFSRMIGLVRGRIFYNLNAWYTVVSLLPGYRWNRAFMEQMMGVSEVASDVDAAAAEDGAGRWRELPRMVRLAGKLMWRVARLDGDVRRFQADFDGTLAAHRDRDLGAMSAHQLVDMYQELERRLLWAWSTPIVNDFFVMIGFGLLRSLCEKWVPGHDDLHNALLSGQGGLDSTAPTMDALELAHAIRGESAALALFRSDRSDPDVWAALQEHPPLYAAAGAWIRRWGDRSSDELKLEVPSIRQQPERIVGLLRGFLSGPPLRRPDEGAGDDQMCRQAEATARAALSGWRTLAFGWVLKFARARVRDRENLRFLRTRIFGLVRDVFNALGDRLTAAGALDVGSDVYWLTVDEAFGWVRGTAVTTNLRGLIAVRKAEYAAFDASPAPADRFHTWGPVWRANGFAGAPPAPGSQTDGLHGLSACPGQVEGVARVVLDPNGEPPLDGAILVTYRTDPGWVPLFPQACAVLVERGSLLSHSAVVAREMGIPTVVGIRGLMDHVKTGDRLRVDASAGTVEIIGGTDE